VVLNTSTFGAGAGGADNSGVEAQPAVEPRGRPLPLPQVLTPVFRVSVFGFRASGFSLGLQLSSPGLREADHLAVGPRGRPLPLPQVLNPDTVCVCACVCVCVCMYVCVCLCLCV